MKCPNCGTVANDKDFDNNDARIAFWVNNEGYFVCECFECNCEWKQKGKEGKPTITKNGD